jgi:ribonuclease P protein component
MAPNDVSVPRLGIVASRKVGNAVVRNRVKRLIREVFRRSSDARPAGVDLVVIPRPGFLDASYDELQRDFSGTLRRALGRLSAQ